MALLSFTLACRKENERPVVDRPLSGAVLAYEFRVGTYWVYLDPVSEQLDSLVVLDVEHGHVWTLPPVHGSTGSTSEYYRIRIKSLLTGEEYNDYLSGNMIRRNGGGEFGQNGQPIWVETTHVPYAFNGMEVLALHPDLIVQDHVFENITETRVIAAEQYQPEFDRDTRLFFVPGVGVVRRAVLLDGGEEQTWDLLRWHVVL